MSFATECPTLSSESEEDYEAINSDDDREINPFKRQNIPEYYDDFSNLSQRSGRQR